MFNKEQLRVLLFKEYLDNRKSILITLVTVVLIPSLISFILLVKIPTDVQDLYRSRRPDGGEMLSSWKKLSRPLTKKLFRDDLICKKAFEKHTVYYLPNNKEAFDLMEIVRKKCSEIIPVAKNNLREMLNNLNDSINNLEFKRTIAAIIFHNISVTAESKYLNYEIIPTSFAANNQLYNIKKLRPMSMMSAYTSLSPYMTSAFAALQILVNEAFLNITEVPQETNGSVAAIFQYANMDDGKEIVFLMPRMVFEAVFISMLLPTLVFIKRILDEKQSEMKQFLRHMSMGETEYWTAKFIIMALLFAVTAIFITILLRVNLEQRIAASLLFFVIYIYFICSLFFAMAFTTFFSRTVTGLSAFLGVQLASTLPLWNFIQKPGLEDFTVFQGETRFSESIHIILCVVATPNYSCILIWFLLLEATVYDMASSYDPKFTPFAPHWSKLFTTPPYYDFISPGLLLLAMIISTVLWFLILVYSFEIEQLQEKAETSLKNITLNRKKDDSNIVNKNQKFFESEPKNLNAGIVIRGLWKHFGKKTAVRDVDLNVYYGQITLLLGHNGAGKTTLMSMITGMFSPSRGRILISGTDISTNPIEAKRNIGLCPQKSFLYDHLTVEENLYIFGILKGFPRIQLIDEIDRVLQLLSFDAERNTDAGTLSGGMRRKLQIGIAIVGGCNVLVLDEPSSGLDIESRRGVWNLLSSIRKEFLIFMTTHHMEEADCLADRIVVMAEGIVQCCGSSQFLKRAFNVGYLLRILTKKQEKGAIEEFVKQRLADVKLERESTNEVLFSFPANQSPKLPDFFRQMDEQSETLGVLSYGVNVTSMDDVFIQSYAMFRDKGKKQKTESLTKFAFEKNMFLSNATKFWAVFLKRFRAERKRCHLFVLFLLISFISSLLSFWILTRAAKRTPYFTDPFKEVLNVKSLGYNSAKGFSSGVAAINENYMKVAAEEGINVIVPNSDLWTESFRLANDYSTYENYRKSYLVGVDSEFERDTYYYVIWYNLYAQHSLPISIDLLFNALLRMKYSDAKIVTSIQTFKEQEFMRSFNKVIQFVIDIYTIPWILLSGFVLAAAFPSSFAAHENVTKTKLLQFMSGVSPFKYWCANFIFDFCYLTLVFMPFWILAVLFFNGYLFRWNSQYVILLGFIGFVLSSISRCYSLSLFLNPSTVYSFVVISSAIPVTVLNVVIHMISLYDSNSFVILSLRTVCSFSPFWVFTEILVKTVKVIDSYHVCKPLPFNIRRTYCFYGVPFFDICCRYDCGEDCITEYYNPFTHPTDGVYKYILWLFILFVAEIGFVFVLETEFCQKRLSVNISKPKKEDNDVLLERKLVERLVSTNETNKSEALVCHDLSKIFTTVTPLNELEMNCCVNPKKIVKNCVAVNHLTFAVHKNEVIGFLGVDGAGKTTTFRLIVGDIYPSQGNAFVSSYSLKQSMRFYQQQIGYCPQVDALLELLTGKETLEYFATLRGISQQNLNAVVKEIIHLTDLDEYAHVESTVYSGGNKRKLALAIALIGSPLVILLDEPTAGVDPVARRRIWKALESYRNVSKGSILLTTHSMDECEALCNRVAILANGELQCLGSIQQLEAKFGVGFTVHIKFKSEAVNFNEIDKEIKSMFTNAECIDNHIPLVVYQIRDSKVTVASLFEFMEKLKETRDLEEYQVSQTNLEQIFLAVQQRQR